MDVNVAGGRVRFSITHALPQRRSRPRPPGPIATRAGIAVLSALTIRCGTHADVRLAAVWVAIGGETDDTKPSSCSRCDQSARQSAGSARLSCSPANHRRRRLRLYDLPFFECSSTSSRTKSVLMLMADRLTSGHGHLASTIISVRLKADIPSSGAHGTEAELDVEVCDPSLTTPQAWMSQAVRRCYEACDVAPVLKMV